jgi:hypothetical protein
MLTISPGATGPGRKLATFTTSNGTAVAAPADSNSFRMQLFPRPATKTLPAAIWRMR